MAVSRIFYVSTILFSLLVLGLYILGAARYLTKLEENTCKMTYMFEYPQYVRISLTEELEERFPRYGLYAYGEGFVTEKHRRMKFSGIPVLFVPGNAGSHEQVRSLASISLRKSLKDRTSFHFDYFTVSLGKDYSALYGGVLEDQTTYVSHCIRKVLSLYRKNVEKVVVIGHSMGGVVAKAALATTNSSDPVNRGNILITLAAPHNPIFLPDRKLARYYEELEGLRLNDTPIVSIGGGRRDILVTSSQTIEPHGALNVISTGIPHVWRSTDHLCILWCKQLIKTIVRALFDCVDTSSNPPRISSNPRLINRTVSYHFTSRISKTIGWRRYEDRVTFERESEWLERPKRRYTWTSGESNRTVFLMIRLDGSTNSIAVDSIGLEARDWLFACHASAVVGNSRVCQWGWNLTNRTSISTDPLHRTRRSVDLRPGDLRDIKASHVVVRIPREELRNVKVHVDLHKQEDRKLRVRDNLSKLLPLGRIMAPNPYAITASSRGCLRYIAVLTDIEDAVAIEVEPQTLPVEGNDSPSIEEPYAIFELFEASTRGPTVPSQIGTLIWEKGGKMTKKRHVMYVMRKDANLRISLGPDHSYKMTIRRAGIVDRISCAVRDRWPLVYPIILSLCLLGIATRLDGSPRATTFTVGIAFFLGAGNVLLETFVALGLLHIVAIGSCVLVVFSGSVTHNFTTRFLARIVALPSTWFEWLFTGFDHLPILTTFIMLSLASATCGAITMLLSVPIYFLKLTRMYNDYLEELLMASLRQFLPRFARRRKKSDESAGTGSDGKISRETLLNHLLLFVTWSFTALPAVPSALVWAKNFRYETRLSTEDQTMLYSWLILTCWGSLGYVEIESLDADKRYGNRRKMCGIALRAIALMLIFTVGLKSSAYYQWIVPPTMAIAFTCVALLSQFPDGDTPIEENGDVAAIED